MSMNRIIKLSSIQGGPFTANNNVVDFDISQDSGAYDLSKSYVNLSCTIDATGDDGSNNGANGIYLPQVKLLQDDLATANEEYYPNVALCRNFKMDCANRGSIVDTRRVDVLRSNLYQYGLSSDEQESKAPRPIGPHKKADLSKNQELCRSLRVKFARVRKYA